MKKRIIIIMSMFIMLCSLTACNEKSKSLNEIIGNIDIVSIDIIKCKNHSKNVQERIPFEEPALFII